MSIDYPGGGGTGPPAPNPGSTGRSEGGWLEWYKENGVWRSRWHSGKPPKGAKKRGEGWVLRQEPSGSSGSTGTGSGSSGSGGSGSGGSGSSGTSAPKDPHNMQPPPRNGRAPYYQPERYFDAVQGRWRWRWRYTATNAEILARRAGLKHDSRGYYRMSGGHRVYQTGRTETGRRYHFERREGRRVKVWDDPYRWPREFNEKRRRLQDRRAQLKSQLESLREQYRKARSDQHVLRRNIMRRVRQVEATLDRVNTSLKRLPKKNPFLLDYSKAKPKLKGGFRVTMDFARDPDDDKAPLSFTNKLRLGRHARLWVRASIMLEDRDWKPGLLGAPEMLRVSWTYPKGWLPLTLGAAATDEYMVSNPLYIVRLFRSPGSGDQTPRFSVRANAYEFSTTEYPNAHKEGKI